MKRSHSLLLLALLLLACGKGIPTLEGIDLDKWKQDKNGCKGDREDMQRSLVTEQIKLKGLSEMDVIGMLGKPDQNELYKRNQKFYSWFLSGAPGCIQMDSDKVVLIVRFNAMGYAQSTSLQAE